MVRKVMFKYCFLLSFVFLCISACSQQKIKKEFDTYLKANAEAKLSKKEIKKVVATATDFLGTKHCIGGSTKKCIDCSGLVVEAFKSINVEMPRRANDQAFLGKEILKIEQLKMGDLVYFQNTYTSKYKITHVGIYLGEGKFIHTSSSKGVMISNLESEKYWLEKFVFGKRL